MRFNILKFAIAGGLYFAFCYAISTVLTLVNVPGFLPFAEILESFYEFYGYSISWGGAVVGAIIGFAEGFINFGIFAWIYNKLVSN